MTYVQHLGNINQLNNTLKQQFDDLRAGFRKHPHNLHNAQKYQLDDTCSD